jgi:hypothetical protein
MEHLIKFYPVDNGDTSLITLIDKTTILIDCKIREGEETNVGNKIFPVKEDLLESLQRKNKIPYLDLFIVTHSDEDHCLGFEKNFYRGDPDNYSESNLKDNQIIVDELWVSSMVFHLQTNDDSKSLKKEAERRRKLWDENKYNKNNPGNRIRLIGYDEDERFLNLPNSIPGETIRIINGKVISNFEFFVHAPFKKHLNLATAEKNQNFGSIVMQARFKINQSDADWKCFFLFGGDSDHNIWAEILKESKAHQNEEKLTFNIFLSPHHCSWTFFNNVPYNDQEENKTPKISSLEILDYKKSSAKIIASCKVIVNNNDNPPHYQAKQQYLKKLDSNNNFLELSKTPNEKEPNPIVFEISSSGIKRKDSGQKIDDETTAALFSIANKAERPWSNA